MSGEGVTVKARRSDPEEVIHPVIRLHIWLETGDGVAFGLGRLMLLEQIDRCGSLKAAAEQMGMSYRAAWGKIKKTEKLLGFALIEKGACRREGYRLTEFGQMLATQFKRWFAEVEDYALDRGRQLLPFSPNGYGSLDE